MSSGLMLSLVSNSNFDFDTSSSYLKSKPVRSLGDCDLISVGAPLTTAFGVVDRQFAAVCYCNYVVCVRN